MTVRPTSVSDRWYDDACGAAHALELVGQRWALLVVRELMFGPRRFGELRESLPGISANVLTQRLEALEASRLLTRHKLASPVNATVYELTPWGYESEPIFQALGRWAARSPSHDPSLPLSAVSLLLSFRTMLDRERADGVTCRVGLRLGTDAFVVRLARGELVITRAVPEVVDTSATGRRPADTHVDVILGGEPAALASVVYGGRSLRDAEAARVVTVEGDRGVARRFVKLFSLPPKAG